MGNDDRRGSGDTAGKVASALTTASLALNVLGPLAGPAASPPDLGAARDENTISSQVEAPGVGEAVTLFADLVAQGDAGAGLTGDIKDLDDWQGKVQADRMDALDEAPDEAESAIHSDPPGEDADEGDWSDSPALADAVAVGDEGDWSDSPGAVDVGDSAFDAGDVGLDASAWCDSGGDAAGAGSDAGDGGGAW